MIYRFFRILGWFSACVFAMGATRAYARPIEIIHTNDLHSHLEHGDEDSRGGYAAVKATIDALKAEAARQGIETLTLDAGDFSEGTPLFFGGDGTDSWRIMQNMGYDAITIGNHDWIVGPDDMNAIVDAVKPSTPMLSANLHPNSRFTALESTIRPYAEFVRAGTKIAVVGLSTHEIAFRWRMVDGGIDSPNDAMEDVLQEVRPRNDLVIALTHLGVDADISLANHVSGVDLIVGGHSHTALHEAVLAKNPDGGEVPIVQAGAHGQFVGDLLVDFEPGKPLQILRYQLIPVQKSGPKDPAIAEEVSSTRQDLERKYGSEWLHQVIGMTDTPMERPADHPTHWGNFFVDAIREAVSADLGLDDSEFFGDSQPAGPITREQLMNFYPRTFDLRRPLGWTVWTIHVPGWLLKIVLKSTVEGGNFFDLSNCTYDVSESGGKIRAKNFRVGGGRLNPARVYKVAVTEGIGRGAKDMQVLLKLLFRPKDSGIPVWSAVENRIRGAAQGLISLEGSAAHRLPASVRWRPAPVEKILNPH